MKKVILQKEFISDLFCLTNSGCDVTDDLYKFLAKDLRDYDLLCDFISVEEYESAALENPILEAMLDNFSKISYAGDIEDKLYDKAFYDGLPEQNVFFTNLKADACEQLSNEKGYIFVSKENIRHSWKFYSECSKGLTLKVTQSKTIKENERMDNWLKFQRLSHPLTSIIIFDKHLLKEITPNDLSINFIPFIENFLITNRNEIFLTIISEIKVGIRLEKYHRALTAMLKERNLENLKVNIVRHNKALYPSNFEGLHARFIITNYLNIIPDASLNFFNKKGKVVNVANIPVSLNLAGFPNDSYKKDIEDIKKYIARVENNEKLGDLNYCDLYFPDKVNPLLN